MKIVSVNLGLPREFRYNNQTFMTAIFKTPAIGKVCVRRMNLEGDRQADLTVHGGLDKAIYAFSYTALSGQKPYQRAGERTLPRNLQVWERTAESRLRIAT